MRPLFLGIWRHMPDRHPHACTRATVALLLVAAVAAIYWPGLHGGFVFDDYPNLVHSERWRAGFSNWAGWRAMLASDTSGALGRPLALASFALNHALTGMDPFWFKLTGLAFHAVNGLLAWQLCEALFARLPAGASPRPGPWAAVLVAAAWTLHPLQVSSVLYVVQRMELGAQLGVLLSLLAYVHARGLQLSRRRGWPWLLAAGLAMLLGLGFKESALLAPGYALLIEACVFRFTGPDGRRSTPWIVAYAVGVALALLAYLVLVWPTATQAAAYAMRDFNATERLLTQMPVLVMYLGQALLPLPESLTFYYDNFPVSRGLLVPPETLLSGLLLLGLLALAAAAWKRWPVSTLGIVWFFVGHALTSNVIPLELAFEHRNYLALLGVPLALVQPLTAAAAKLRLHRDARLAMACMPVIGLAALCAIQAATWGDPLRLAWALENRNPGSARAVYDLGARLLEAADGDREAPAWSMARGQFERAMALPGGSTLAAQGLLLMYGHAGREPPENAWTSFRAAMTRHPLGVEATGALYAVSQCRIDGRCRFDDSELLATFIQVLERNPRSDTAHTLYANFAWNVLQDRPLALRMQRAAVALAPDAPANRIALAKFLLASGVPTHRAEALQIAAELRREDRHGRFATELREIDTLRGESAENGVD